MVDLNANASKREHRTGTWGRFLPLLFLLLGTGMIAANRRHLFEWQPVENTDGKRLAREETKHPTESENEIREIPSNPNPTCQRLQESFGIDFTGVSAPHAWSSHINLFLERSRLPIDPKFDEKEYIEWTLNKITHRLPRGVQHLPRDWKAMEAVLAKMVTRYQYLKMPKQTSVLPPPPVTVLVMGGSVAMGVNCNSPGDLVTEQRCAWPFRLESFLNQLAGFGATYDRKDDSTKLVRVLNKSSGGLNSADGEALLRYEMFETTTFDVIINAYGTNDMHIKTIKDAEKSGVALVDYAISIKQDFIRTALSVDGSRSLPLCNDDNPEQKNSPWVLLLNDYIGNEQRSVLEIAEGGHVIDLLASHYGLGAISYPDMIRDLVYANTTNQNFSPPWYSPTKVGMKREVHHGAVFHRIAVFMISYYLWVSTTTYCGMVIFSPEAGESDFIRTGLPPRLSKDLVVDTISEEWKEHDRLRGDLAATTKTNTSTPCSESAETRCSFSWISLFSKTDKLEEFFAPYIHQPSTTWTLVDQRRKRDHTGWSPPTDGVGQAMVLDIPVASRTIQTVVLYIEKGKGGKWENSTASIEFLKSTPESDWESVLGPLVLTGYHEEKKRKIYTEEWTLPEAVVRPEKLRIRLLLKQGHTFKLTGIAACDASTDSSHLVPGSRPKFPPQCNIAEREALVKQLPERNCNDNHSSTQTCSFSNATTIGCVDSYWVRETLARRKRTDGQKFRAVFIGRACEEIQRVGDILQVGTHDMTKYLFGGKGCQKPVAYATDSKVLDSESVCINANATEKLLLAKQTANITDTELRILPLDVTNSSETIDEAMSMVGLNEKPIDYLWLDGNAYEVFASGNANAILSRVRYLEFGINHEEKGSFEELVLQRLVHHEFVCYWRGTEQNLWRITDCWFKHYEQKQLANVACVSAAHDDAESLLQRMELSFAETLQRDIAFM